MKPKLQIKSNMVVGWWEYIFRDYLECKIKLPKKTIHFLTGRLRPWVIGEEKIEAPQSIQIGKELIVITESTCAERLWLLDPRKSEIKRIKLHSFPDLYAEDS